MELAKVRISSYDPNLSLVDYTNEGLFELTKQLGNNVRVNPYSGDSYPCTPTLIALHDCIWIFIIRFGDGCEEVNALKQIFRTLNPDAYMILLD